MLKKGMKVRIRSDLKVGNFYGSLLFTKVMERFKEKEITIAEQKESYGIIFYTIKENDVLCITEEMVESITKESPMPKLESGMFVKNTFGHYGVIVEGKIIYNNGGYDILSRAIARDGFIKQVIENNCGFGNLSNGKIIWEYKEKKEENPKTYFEDFMKNNPGYKCDIYKIPYICAGRYYDFYCPRKVSCKDCWNAPKGTWE